MLLAGMIARRADERSVIRPWSCVAIGTIRLTIAPTGLRTPSVPEKLRHQSSPNTIHDVPALVTDRETDGPQPQAESTIADRNRAAAHVIEFRVGQRAHGGGGRLTQSPYSVIAHVRAPTVAVPATATLRQRALVAGSVRRVLFPG